MKTIYYWIKSTILNFIRMLLLKYGYSVNYIIRPRFATNAFKTNYSKKVLISYLIEPFIADKIPLNHTGYTECYTAAKIFNNLGYQVDVVNWREKIQLNYNEYDIIYGLGEAFERVFYSENAERILKIAYATGCCHFYVNKHSVKRVAGFYKRHGKIIPQSSRILPGFRHLQHCLSDLIIVLGNNYTANTFKSTSANNNVRTINSFYFKSQNITIDDKDIEQIKKNFMWFGSNGLIHKGLDLLLDFFKEHTEYTLHICGASSSERIFFEHYNNELLGKKPNIINHGFVDIDSKKFKNILVQCCFAILPSASEGGSPSLVNVIVNGGLIPIAPIIVGIEMFGIDSLIINRRQSYDDIKKKIIETGGFTNSVITELSKKFQRYYLEKYSFENYEKKMGKIIIEGINEHKK
jgi:hypothetical protein